MKLVNWIKATRSNYLKKLPSQKTKGHKNLKQQRNLPVKTPKLGSKQQIKVWNSK